MASQYIPLPLSTLGNGATYRRPARGATRPVSKSDPATWVMTDLEEVAAVTTGPDVNIDTANQQMITSGVRMLLVLDEDETIIGLLTANDVLGERPMMHLQRYGGRHSDILVRHIMTPRDQLEVLKMEDVIQGKVGDIVATLVNVSRQHALVVNVASDGSQTIRGIFSSTQIARQLGEPVEVGHRARTFAELEEALTA